MATIRVLTKDDVPAAAALFARVYPQHRWHSQAACEAYFRDMLFDNPWRDPELPSWVAEQSISSDRFDPPLNSGRPVNPTV